MGRHDKKLFTSESVTEGHPDKLADRIADSILDAILIQDPEARVACEVFLTTGLALIGGEITTTTSVNIPRIARDQIRAVGYDRPEHGFNCEEIAVLTSVSEQSPDIAQAVSRAKETRGGQQDRYQALGAGDQGIMYGYANNMTEELMPLPIMLAHRLTRRMAEVRKERILPYLRPDGKSQVTVEYEGRAPIRVHTVLISAQHDPELSKQELETGIRKAVIEPILDDWMDKETKVRINPSGRFVEGGPQADTGMTGRKIIVDTYGGYGSHGGGALSGKDPTKVDRSGSYMARYVAVNVVAAGLAEECEIQIAYAIGMIKPIAITVNSFGTGRLSDSRLAEIIRDSFDFRPAAIIETLDLRRPIYQPLSAYGHFGRPELDLPWEWTDRVEALKERAGL
ncbi:MAG: methionine adenosyltransferase [Candidatus Bipolaricaulia bacterium]